MIKNNHMTAVNFLKTSTAPFLSASAVLRCYRNRLIIIIAIIITIIITIIFFFFFIPEVPWIPQALQKLSGDFKTKCILGWLRLVKILLLKRAIKGNSVK